MHPVCAALVVVLLCLMGWNAQSKTVFEFKRLLDTCDPQDNPVPIGAAKVVWAYSDEVPTNEDSIHQHTNMGQYGIRLRNPSNVPLPPDASYFDLTVLNSTIPFSPQSPDTTYYCKVFALPITHDPAQIVRWEPVIEPANLDVIHHMLSFECPLDTFDPRFVGWEGDCNGRVPDAVQGCMGGNVFSAWAVGGLPYNFPVNVGYPLNNNTARYVMLETHYNNQQQRPVVDSSGMRFYKTYQLREHDAGVMGVGLSTYPGIWLPANTAASTLTGYCIQNCTRSMLPTQGVTVVGSILHAHLAGRALKLRHVRGGVELPPIADEPFYDFNFQDIDVVWPPRVVLPGDLMIMECTYDTRGRPNPTTFGLATHNEMCLSYNVYYPRTPGAFCSYVNFTAFPVPPDSGLPNVSFVMCGDTSYQGDTIDSQIHVPAPYTGPNCTHVPPDPSRTTPQPLMPPFDFTQYLNHQLLDDQGVYQLHWSVDLEMGEIALALEVDSDGWVGFGLSPNGQMPGSDVSIGWIGADQSVNHRDRHAVKHALPPQDTFQDYYDIRGWNSLRSAAGGSGRNSTSSNPIMTTARIIGVSIAGSLVVVVVACFCMRKRSDERRTALTTSLNPDYDSNDDSHSRRVVSSKSKRAGGGHSSSHVGNGGGSGSYYVSVPAGDTDAQTEYENSTATATHGVRGASPDGQPARRLSNPTGVPVGHFEQAAMRREQQRRASDDGNGNTSESDQHEHDHEHEHEREHDDGHGHAHSHARGPSRHQRHRPQHDPIDEEPPSEVADDTEQGDDEHEQDEDREDELEQRRRQQQQQPRQTKGGGRPLQSSRGSTGAGRSRRGDA